MTSEEYKLKLGDKVETTYVENVAEGPDAERVIRQLAQDGNDIIFATSFGFMNPTLKVAKQFPDVKFEHATGYQTAENMAAYNAKFYEGRAVLGTIAGMMSKSGKAGYVASFPIPEVVMGINAFTQAMAQQLIGRGIRVNAVAPGPIWTPLIPSTFSAEKVGDHGVKVPMERPGQPAEVAPAYVYLASEDSSYVTGQVMHVNGGEIVNG